jgi:hypothetical protein
MGAIGSYAPHVRASDVLLLHDATVFGSGKKGFLLTADSICWRNDSTARSLKYVEIRSISKTMSTSILSLGKIVVNAEFIEVNSSTVDRRNMICHILADFLLDITKPNKT